MDREQAINIIKDCKEKSFKRTLYTLDEYYEAVNMAIQALEQQPTDAVQRTSNANKKHVENTLEDAISRQAVFDTLKEMMQPCGDGLSIYDQDNFIHNETLADVYQTVEELPPVTVQEKTGRWIDVQSHWSDLTRFQCTCDQCGDFSNKITPFCPNCGAKMEGVEE